MILNAIGATEFFTGRFARVLMACLLLVAMPAHADNESAVPVDTDITSSQETPVNLPALSPTSAPTPSPASPLATSKSPTPSAQHNPAAATKEAAPGTRINSSTHLASVAVALVFIVGLILALGWFLRRFNQGGLFQNSAIKIIASLPLGTRERLAVVDVGGQQLLLGITATQITTLHVFNEPIIAPGENSPAASDFGKKLMAILQQKNNRDAAAPQDKTAV